MLPTSPAGPASAEQRWSASQCAEQRLAAVLDSMVQRFGVLTKLTEHTASEFGNAEVGSGTPRAGAAATGGAKAREAVK